MNNVHIIKIKAIKTIINDDELNLNIFQGHIENVMDKLQEIKDTYEKTGYKNIYLDIESKFPGYENVKLFVSGIRQETLREAEQRQKQEEIEKEKHKEKQEKKDLKRLKEKYENT